MREGRSDFLIASRATTLSPKEFNCAIVLVGSTMSPPCRRNISSVCGKWVKYWDLIASALIPCEVVEGECLHDTREFDVRVTYSGTFDP